MSIPREAALDAAIRVDAQSTGSRQPGLTQRVRDVLDAADEIYTWLTRPVRLIGRVGTPTPISEGNTMANPQVPVSYEFTLTIEPEDLEGNAVGDTLTWTSSDETDAPVAADSTTLIGTVQVLNPAVDNVITATDGTNTYEYTFDGVADAPVALVAAVGAPTKIPAAGATADSKTA